MIFGSKKESRPTIYSEETCTGCGEKNRRSFKGGDYVFKEGVKCKKCAASTIVTAIYGEYPPEKA